MEIGDSSRQNSPINRRQPGSVKMSQFDLPMLMPAHDWHSAMNSRTSWASRGVIVTFKTSLSKERIWCSYLIEWKTSFMDVAGSTRKGQKKS
jgi:hypothetical protein